MSGSLPVDLHGRDLKTLVRGGAVQCRDAATILKCDNWRHEDAEDERTPRVWTCKFNHGVCPLYPRCKRGDNCTLLHKGREEELKLQYLQRLSAQVWSLTPSFSYTQFAEKLQRTDDRWHIEMERIHAQHLRCRYSFFNKTTGQTSTIYGVLCTARDRTGFVGRSLYHCAMFIGFNPLDIQRGLFSPISGSSFCDTHYRRRLDGFEPWANDRTELKTPIVLLPQPNEETKANKTAETKANKTAETKANKTVEN